MRKKTDTRLIENKEELKSRIVIDLFVYDTLMHRRPI